MHGRTLETVDRVRFGRALGYGTRHAAKTLAAAMDAATASSSTPVNQPPSAQAPSAQPSASAPAQAAPLPRQSRQAVESAGSRRTESVRVRQGAQHLRRSFWQPLAVFTGALWLRVTGVFFALLAITMGGGTWRARGALKPGAGSSGASHFWLFVSFTLLFGYFAISSFVRANLKERRGAAGYLSAAGNKDSAR